jgi:NAD(P)-dependent dehydrogenase (short-subunit alcohol dehydrogenase family)
MAFGGKMIFSNQGVVVTGGSSGIGLSTAKIFASKGASVLITSLSEEENAKAAKDLQNIGGQIFAIRADVSVEDDWSRVLEYADLNLPQVDILVNNAGMGFRGSVLETDTDTWEKIFDVNVKGVFLGCRTFLPQMILRQKGSIVNVSSVAGNSIAMADRAAYVSTKGAINALTKAMAIDHSPFGVRVNAVAPGTTDTPYFHKFLTDHQELSEYRATLSKRQILGRMATPDEIAQAIVWMASDQASFCTGTILDVDGGWSIW